MRFQALSLPWLFLLFVISSCSTVTRKVSSVDAPKNMAYSDPEITTDPKASSDIPTKREFPVNPAFSPCDDFYQYACSKVNASFRLRDDRSYHVFAFSDSNERLLEAKKKFLAELGSAEGLSPRGEALKTVYTACMDEDASKKEEVDLVKKGMKEIEELKTRPAFLKYVAKKIVSEDYSFLSFGSLASSDDPDQYDVLLMGDVQSLPERTYYDKPDVMADFEGIVTGFFSAIGAPNAEARAKAVVAFEKEFSRTFPLPVQLRELINMKTGITRAELEKNFPAFELGDFFKHIPAKTHIRNLTPENFKFLNTALSTAPLETLKDVYLFHSLVEYMDDAYPAFFKKRFDFNHKHLGGPEKRPDRQERCTTMIMHKFPKEIDAELLPKLFPDFPTAKFVALAEKVRGAILDGLKNNTWLSPKSRAAALEKMRVAKLQLVKPMNDEEWDFNPTATYSPDRPYHNARVLRKNLLLKELKELKKKRNRAKWSMGPLTVNAYYSPPDNKFVLPIGILQYPFYDPSLPDEENLGAVGAVIGHELGHGIDDKGSRYDSKGRLSLWMSEADLNEFKDRGQALVAEFNAIGHNGELTLGENIGDLVGLTFAYRAAFPNGNGSRDAKKAFFLQYARLWCTVMRPKYREMLLRVDPHSAGPARVNEQMKQQAGFSEAYGCHAGNRLYLPDTKRVHIW